jgi:hypothetical protein
MRVGGGIRMAWTLARCEQVPPPFSSRLGVGLCHVTRRETCGSDAEAALGDRRVNGRGHTVNYKRNLSYVRDAVRPRQ